MYLVLSALISNPVSLLLTEFFTPWSRVLLEKLTVFQLVKEFPAFYVTRRFITAIMGRCHHGMVRPQRNGLQYGG